MAYQQPQFQQAVPVQYGQPAQYAQHVQPAEYAAPPAQYDQPGQPAPQQMYGAKPPPPPPAVAAAPQAPPQAGQGEWNSGVCDCCSNCDCPFCCLTCCFPCIGHGIVVDKSKGGGCVTPCIIYYCTSICYLNICFFGPQRRSHIREKYGLPEEPCNDCCTECWCGACAICQEMRELKARGHAR